MIHISTLEQIEEDIVKALSHCNNHKHVTAV